ncbi:unnamed protein product [Acanthosepion pharaonis]|uniref:Uncharacterized protein n=1 Tax=Acanthosepion pharaonis TaxID=158019 RepID=A0A812D7F5_ACAPH|nr:unnamed protein product [Sepia pharaonis]
MLRFALLFLLFVTLISAEQIILSVNSSTYIEGTPAKLSCLFPRSIRILEWRNVDNVMKTPLRCTSESSCGNYTGYHLSRVRNNITLIINHVNKSLSTWVCSDLHRSLSETVKLNITDNPMLDIEITEENLHYRIKTSCSSFPFNVTCLLNDKPLEIKRLTSKPCHIPFLKYLSGYLEPSSKTGTIRCTVQQNNEKVTATLKLTITYLYYIGGVIIGIGVIVAICFHFYKRK